MKSMTGFGRGEYTAKGVTYEVEIATVNRKHAEIVFHLPRELAPAENSLREIIAPALARGRATVTANIGSGAKARPLVDSALFRRLHGELVSLQRSLRIPGEVGMPEVISLYAATAREGAAAAEPDLRALHRATAAALKSLERMRATEGAHLADELRRLLRKFESVVESIAKIVPDVTRRHRHALRARLAEVDLPFAADDERLARELAIFADRADITEELSRLESHIAQFRSGLSAKGANGRTLDFLAQEMFRECNTIGSKANSADVAQKVIAAKTELERIREQVQNAE
jgi:uncharacterized protein (TIGR00255 family)